MKLRIRSSTGGPTLKLDIASPASLQALREALASRLALSPSSFRLSLNKRDEIHGPPDALLTTFGLRSGDLLFYLNGPGPVSVDAVGMSAVTVEAVSKGLDANSEMDKALTTTQNGGRGAGTRMNLSGAVDGVDSDARIRRELCAAAAIKRVSSSGSSSGRKADDRKVEDSLPDGNISTSTAGYPSDDSTIERQDGKQIDDMDFSTGWETEATEMEGPYIEGSFTGRYSIPVLFQRVLLEEDGNVNSPYALVILGVHAVMLETGFVGFDPEKGSFLQGSYLPGGWSTKVSLSLSYSVPDIGSSEHATGVGSVLLRFQALGNSVVVYGTVIGERGSQIYRLCLETSKFLSHEKFLQSCSEGKLTRETPEAASMDVFGFWKVVKDCLSIRLLTDLCERSGLPVPASLLILPTELKMRILEALPALDLVRAGCTCSELRHLVAKDELWREKFMGEFGFIDGERPPCGRGWKDAFQQRWKERKRRQQMRGRRYQVFPGHVPRYGFPSGLGSPHFGFTGGDYDRFPVIGGGGFRGGFGSSGRGPLGGLFRGMGGAGSGSGGDNGDFSPLRGGMRNITDADELPGTSPLNVVPGMGTGGFLGDFFQ